MSALANIVAAIQARTALIDGTGDFSCDVSSQIHLGREGFHAEHDTFPLATISSSGWRKNDEANSLNVRAAEISVSLLSQAKEDSPLETELDLCADLEAALYPLAKRVDGRDDLDGTALWLECDGCVILARQDGGKLCEVRIDLLVNYQEPAPCA